MIAAPANANAPAGCARGNWPLDELLGELLLTDGRREEAAAAFQKTLTAYPNRRLAVEGLVASGTMR